MKAWLENRDEVSSVGLSLAIEWTARLERGLRTLLLRSAIADIDLLLERPLLRGEVLAVGSMPDSSEGASEDCGMISMELIAGVRACLSPLLLAWTISRVVSALERIIV